MLQIKRDFQMQTLRRVFITSGALLTALLALTSYAEAKKLYSFQGSNSQAQTFTTLATFNGNNGASPTTPVVQASDSNFYGTTGSGGANGFGTIFKMTPSGVLTTLYNFSDSDGAYPHAGLIQGTDGNLYGTTYAGGTGSETINASGTVFNITLDGSLTTLYNFQGASDGAGPTGNLVQGSDGNFYGTTQAPNSVSYGGTIFKITPAGTLTTLYHFCTQPNCPDGYGPVGALVQGTDGNFYGTTTQGGANDTGTVFKITPEGVLTTLYSFTDQSDGGLPGAGLIQASDGNFYGTTSNAGANGWGTAFKITSGGALTTIYSFCALTNCSDGAGPTGNLVQGSDGNFFGTSPFGGGAAFDGVIFQLTLGGSLTTMYAFTGGSDQGQPSAPLIQAINGNLYGTTQGEGNGLGTVFSLYLGLVEPAPVINSLSPPSANAGGAAFTLTVNGTNFAAGATVQWNSTALPTTFLSSTQLRAAVSTNLIASQGTASITVSSGGLTSTPVTFAINATTGSSGLVWTLQYVGLNAGTLSGNFTYDATTNTYSNWSITVSGAEDFDIPSETFTPANSSDSTISSTAYYLYLVDPTTNNALVLNYNFQALTNAGGTLSLSSIGSYVKNGLNSGDNVIDEPGEPPASVTSGSTSASYTIFGQVATVDGV
jgi:uncharacterized repeat protein (TIGR03803 family)